MPLRMNMKTFLLTIIVYGSCIVDVKSNPVLEKSNQCEELGIDPDGGLFEHDSSCQNFYQCSHGNPVLMECPEGLLFNAKTKQCDWPAESGCSQGFFKDNIPCKEYPEPSCPPHQVNKPAVHLPHPKDCRKFYECDWEVPYESECPEGLHFNANLQVCDFPEKANCACATLNP